MKNVTARRLTLACLAGVGMLPAFGSAGTVLGAPPEDKFSIEVVDDEFPSMLFTETCGFDTWYTLDGTIKLSSHNNDVTIIRYSLTRTLNGPGGALTLSEVGLEKVVTEPTEDGFIETIHAAGHFNHSWVVPGYGPVELNAGTARFELTFVWDELAEDFIVTEEILQEAGPRDRELTESDVEALCGYLD